MANKTWSPEECAILWQWNGNWRDLDAIAVGLDRVKRSCYDHYLTLKRNRERELERECEQIRERNRTALSWKTAWDSLRIELANKDM